MLSEYWKEKSHWQYCNQFLGEKLNNLGKLKT